ncbi:dual specificity mitogen-activated protein kinase kinase 6-like [Saccoglossus kowalevskii]|uniref:mitogen-activated protein kinase kinase n=1 Tax=Saccoglossus kowalevskii TaxID=10224 RepID=A0ABM0M3U4_SACKO|nr:PREDICTED: dual specificity mitogen-activated protein kinase kinase 6-like [Saccoglossus kowalevskii]
MSASRTGRKKPPRFRGELKFQPPVSPPTPENLPADNKASITVEGKNFLVRADDLKPICELGRGAYGVVEKVKHEQSGTVMAVKRIRAQVNSKEDKRIVMDMDVAMRSSLCPFTVTFYGAMFQEPERIDPEITQNEKGYDIKSDVWSLGITMIELATGNFPYASWGTPFAQLKQVVKEPSPKLPDGIFSQEFVNFTELCLKKNFRERPSYPSLLKHEFIAPYESKTVDVASYVQRILVPEPDNQ